MGMESGFFSRAELTVRPRQSRIPNCGRCKLDLNCKSPYMKPSGGGRRRVLILGEWPGWSEDAENLQFTGRTGDYLRTRLERIGVDMRRDCWLHNALSCYPKDQATHKTAVEDCRPNVLKAIEQLQPDVIVPTGRAAIKSLIGYLWKEDIGAVSRWTGHRIPSQAINAWVVPTHNPAYLLRQQERDPDPVLGIEFDRHLESAFALAGPPWPDGPPNYAARVEKITDPDEVADRLARYTGGRIAWDIETTTLKPDGPNAEIVCASVCWEGVETIAFPWVGAARRALIDVLENPDVSKVGWNEKFEDRWTRRVMGCKVRGWEWDGMLVAHAIDPRRGATGLKFNAFTVLGMPPYNEAIEPYLSSVKPGGNSKNRIREVDLPRILGYCGTDSILEYEIAKRQMKLIGG